jgi:hypothetical protein
VRARLLDEIAGQPNADIDRLSGVHRRAPVRAKEGPKKGIVLRAKFLGQRITGRHRIIPIGKREGIVVEDLANDLLEEAHVHPVPRQKVRFVCRIEVGLTRVPHLLRQSFLWRGSWAEGCVDRRRFGRIGGHGVRVPLESPTQRIFCRQTHHDLHGLRVFLEHCLAVRAREIISHQGSGSGICFAREPRQYCTGRSTDNAGRDEIATRQSRQWNRRSSEHRRVELHSAKRGCFSLRFPHGNEHGRRGASGNPIGMAAHGQVNIPPAEHEPFRAPMRHIAAKWASSSTAPDRRPRSPDPPASIKGPPGSPLRAGFCFNSITAPA